MRIPGVLKAAWQWEIIAVNKLNGERFWLLYGEALEQVGQGGCGCLKPGSVQSQVGVLSSLEWWKVSHGTGVGAR